MIRLRICPLLFAAALPFCVVSVAPSQNEPQDHQQDVERLRRDQDEILRKAGRLRDFMDRLRQRYEREDKKEQAELLRQGLAHLEQAGLLRDVASIRDDLVANALSDAVRKQQEVVDDIERLLNILLQRHSIENIDQEIKDTTELAGKVRDLERRQAQLQKQTQQAGEREATPQEQQLEQALQQLARDQSTEAQRNARDAGARRPFLENALRAVKELLRQQDRLEERTAAERAGKTTAERERAFDLGELLEQARNLATDVRDQRRQTELQQTAEQLQQAITDGNQGGAQQARDELEAQLQREPDRRERAATPRQQTAGIDKDQDWEALRQTAKNAPAGSSPQDREQLQQLATEAKKVATQREQIARDDNADAATQLAEATRSLAAKLAGEPKPAADSPAAAAEDAAKALQQAASAAKAGDTSKAQESVQAAMRSLEEARRRQREQNPDAERLAQQMAASADSTERNLRNAPAAESPEQQAADALDRAEQALRQAGENLGETPSGQPPAGREQTDKQVADSRQNLEQAKRTLEDALRESGADRQQDMQSAAARQQELNKRAEQMQQQLQQARRDGGINEQQQQKADEAVQSAAKSMQSAAQSLQQGEQSTASQQQQQAAEALQQAQKALQQHRTPGPEQQQAMKDLAAQQQQIEDEILRLAEEAKKRKNAEARRALDDAADAAKKAQRGMQNGDNDDTEEQQERARQKLDEAAQQLEEERDRYVDQRQEELLFRVKEELLGFLEKQQPITAETETLHKSATAEGLSRPARRKLNQFAEEEQALAARLQAIVTALTEEGNLVYRTVLVANHDDLQEVGRRLSGRNPDPSSYTTMLQHDVEHRTKDLLEALDREQKRRKEQQQQQQQQQQGQNRFNPQRQKLVSLIAELEMLKQLEQDTDRAAQDLRTLVELHTGDNVTDAETAMLERLLHRHGEVTRLFQKIKAGIEETMQSMQGGDDQGDNQGHGHGR